MAHLGVLVGDLRRAQPAVDRLPGLAAVVRAERAGRGDRDEHAVPVGRVVDDRVQAHAAGAGLPAWPRLVGTQRGQFLPVLAAVGRAEDRRVLGTGVHRVGVVQRRFEVPDPLELPRSRRPVVPQVVAHLALVGELVADRLPGAAPVVGALDQLAEPARRLRGVQPVRVGRRPLDVVDLPAAEVWAGHLPVPARTVGGQDERALACTDEYPYAAHAAPPSGPPRCVPPPTILTRARPARSAHRVRRAGPDGRTRPAG